MVGSGYIQYVLETPGSPIAWLFCGTSVALNVRSCTSAFKLFCSEAFALDIRYVRGCSWEHTNRFLSKTATRKSREEL